MNAASETGIEHIYAPTNPPSVLLLKVERIAENFVRDLLLNGKKLSAFFAKGKQDNEALEIVKIFEETIVGFLKPFFTVLDPLSPLSPLGIFRRFVIQVCQTHEAIISHLALCESFDRLSYFFLILHRCHQLLGHAKGHQFVSI